MEDNPVVTVNGVRLHHFVKGQCLWCGLALIDYQAMEPRPVCVETTTTGETADDS